MVALIFCGDLKYCPYIKRYIERIEKSSSQYCVLFWNRSGFEINYPENYIYFDSKSDLAKGKLSKVVDFIKFRRWLIAKLREISPDKIIALSTLTGVLLGRKLYKGKVPYVFDIRDYSYEHIRPFYMIEKKVINNSVFTAISSKGFMNFLPPHDYVIAHNFNRKDVVEQAKFRKRNGKLSFVWNGVVRYFEFQKQYLDALKNDERFTIVFHGDGPEVGSYKSYCSDNGFENAIFTGSYDNEKKTELLKEADILNNCYGYVKSAGNKLKYAVSNRFYDGMIYHIPQIVEPDGFKTDWAKSSGVGISLPLNEDFADKLYEYYMNLDEFDFDVKCTTELQKVIKEDDVYTSKIDSFII